MSTLNKENKILLNMAICLLFAVFCFFIGVDIGERRELKESNKLIKLDKNCSKISDIFKTEGLFVKSTVVSADIDGLTCYIKLRLSENWDYNKGRGDITFTSEQADIFVWKYEAMQYYKELLK
jgi:hypothetical protein